MAKKICKACGDERDVDLAIKMNGDYFCCVTCLSVYKNAQKQDEVIEEISNKDIMIALKALILAITNPPYIDKTTNQIRAQVTGTVTSSTTIAAVTNSVNIDSYQGKLQVVGINTTAWAIAVRSLIT